MDELVRRALDAAKASWSRKSTLVATLGLVLGGWLYIAARIDFAGDIALVEWLLLLPLALIVVGIWSRTNRVPRTPAGHIGLVLAISTESEREAAELRQDFIHALRELLETLHLQSPLALQVYHPRMAAEVKTAEDALRYVEVSRAHLIVYGQAKRRRVGAQDAQILDLRLLVRHAPITPQTQAVLAKELNDVFLPPDLSFDRQDAHQAFRFTADWMDLAVRYVAGLAALVSGDLDCAEELLQSVAQRLNRSRFKQEAPLGKIGKKLPAWLREINLHRLSALTQEYVRTRDPTFLEQAEPVVEEIERFDGGRNYSACLMKAICCFVLRRDVAGARRAIRAADVAAKKKDATWRFSEAFLHAYEGDLGKAHAAYRRAFAGVTSNEDVHLQTEEFLQEVLDLEPDKIQLHFCLGLLNFFLKEDTTAAAYEMRTFLGATTGEQWPEQRRLADEYIRKAEQHQPNEAA